MKRFLGKGNKYKKNNKKMIQKATAYREHLITNATESELRVKRFLSSNGEKYKFQEIIYIENSKLKGKIDGFFIVDFLRGKQIIEIDGLYHHSQEQALKDYKRSVTLKKMGYNLVRISNFHTNYTEVLNEKIFGYQKYAA